MENMRPGGIHGSKTKLQEDFHKVPRWKVWKLRNRWKQWKLWFVVMSCDLSTNHLASTTNTATTTSTHFNTNTRKPPGPSSMSNSTASQAAHYEARTAAAAAKDGDLNPIPTKSTQSAPASPTSLHQSLQTKSAEGNPSPHRNSADRSPRGRSDRYGPPKCGRQSGHQSGHVALSASMQPSGTCLETVSSTPPGLPPRTLTILHSPCINPTLNAHLNARLNALPKKLRCPNARPNTCPKKINPHMTASGSNAPCGPPSGNENEKDDKENKDKDKDDQAPPIATLGSPPPSTLPEDEDHKFGMSAGIYRTLVTILPCFIPASRHCGIPLAAPIRRHYPIVLRWYSSSGLSMGSTGLTGGAGLITGSVGWTGSARLTGGTGLMGSAGLMTGSAGLTMGGVGLMGSALLWAHRPHILQSTSFSAPPNVRLTRPKAMGDRVCGAKESAEGERDRGLPRCCNMSNGFVEPDRKPEKLRGWGGSTSTGWMGNDSVSSAQSNPVCAKKAPGTDKASTVSSRGMGLGGSMIAALSIPIAIPAIFPNANETSNTSRLSASFSPAYHPSSNPLRRLFSNPDCLACSTRLLCVSFTGSSIATLAANTTVATSSAAARPILYATFHICRITAVLFPALVYEAQIKLVGPRGASLNHTLITMWGSVSGCALGCRQRNPAVSRCWDEARHACAHYRNDLHPFKPHEAEGNGDINPDAFSLNFPQGLLSFDDKEEEDEGKEEEEEESADKGWVDENDSSALIVLHHQGTHAERHPHMWKTAMLKEGQVKAHRKGMKEAVETLHKYIKTHAEKIAKIFRLSKAEVQGIIMSTTKLKRPQAYHKFNAKVWQTCWEHNTGKPKGERIGIMEGCTIVAAQPKSTWSQAHLDRFKHDWMLDQVGKAMGTHKTNTKATKDVTLTGDRIFEELLRLEKHTGMCSFCVLAGSHANNTIWISVISSVDSVWFLPDVFRMDSGTFATKYRNWLCFDADAQVVKEEKHPGKKATGKPKLDIQFVCYKELMHGKEGYENCGVAQQCSHLHALQHGHRWLSNAECYWRAVELAVHAEIDKVFAEAGKKKKPRKKRAAAKADNSDDTEETEKEEEEVVPPLKKRKNVARKKPAASEDKEEEEALPKKKAVKHKRAQEEEEEAPPRKKAVKKKKVPAVEDEEEEETPKEKAGKKKAVAKEKKRKGKEKEKEVGEKRNPWPDEAPPLSQAMQTSLMARPRPPNHLRLLPVCLPLAAARASTSKAAASSFMTGWESVQVMDKIHQKSKEAADKMKMQIAADRKAGVLPLAKPKAKPKLIAKSLQEIADQDYGSSEED
ncbi:hypothetical protein B0H17DRAFT_1130687 [Mycena rosella]|uniref:Uncharacterized protein n=1 Tax=Mycena rosella TaxID=1033263 RepID=A0AAD7DS80_MYCRO|nr:hypothetical protein B0H17DRAFT_1130687 [Mycena rosella]